MHYRIIPKTVLICAIIGAAVTTIVDAISKILFTEDKFSDIIIGLGFGELI